MKLTNKTLWQTQAFINGEFVDAASAKTFAVENPFDLSEIAQVADCDGADAESAVQAAHAALADWRALTVVERSDLLIRWHDLIAENTEDLAQIVTYEEGKTIEDARGEVRYSNSFIKWFANEGLRAYGDVVPTDNSAVRRVILKQGIGVVGCVTPWNFPAAMVTRNAAPALVTGCPIVIKPAQDTPLTALAYAELARQAGIPAGVFNVVPCLDPKPVGDVLTQSSLISMFSFTGSVAVGKQLMAQCASTVKKMSLELGGNAPFIVFDDADVDHAVAGALAAKFRGNGQVCIAANRIFIHDAIYDEFVSKLTAEIAKLKVGDGADESVQATASVNPKILQRVKGIVDDAVASGATVECGGVVNANVATAFQPSVITGVTPDMRIFKEEIFGPVASIIRFNDEAEVTALANSTEYGLAAYCYTKDLGRSWRMAENLEFGIVGINTGSTSSASMPFGGVKQSGLGREGSKYGLEEYLEIKAVTFGV